MITERMINWIKGHEGLVLTPQFDDYAGTPDVIEFSIGYGHQIQPNEHWMFSGITKAQAEQILISDIKKSQALIKMYVSRHLNQKQLDALTNLVYSVGIGGASHIIALINAHASKKTIIPFWLNTGIYWQGKVWSNLQKGRQTEIHLFYADQWQAPVIISGSLLTLFAFYKHYHKTKTI